MDTAPFRLTFGVELEFLVRFGPEDPADNWFEDCRNRILKIINRILEILRAKGFSAHGFGSTSIWDWTVTIDGSVSDKSCINSNGIELKSPALDYSPSALQQVMDVVKLLVSELNPYVNKTCGLHVHVGNESRGFTVRTLKTFASLITAFEQQLNSLHPLDRHENGFAKPLHWAFCKDTSPRDKMLIIDELETVDDLICRFHPVYDASSGEYVAAASRHLGWSNDACSTEYASEASPDYDWSNDRNMAFNFFNLRSDEPLNTIEFRQHQGTLDPDQIANWVRLTCTLVHMSHANEDAVFDLIEQHLDDPNYTVMDLVADLHLPDLASFYAPLVARHEKEWSDYRAFETATLRVSEWLTDL
ncbi:hypothetical protein MMC07_008243 [Pseudocyphellaria aurata]|nr:hypothetical protein [Pseudocyphellaria aurata]